MHDIFVHHTELVWALTILIAWFTGELGYQLTNIPRISFYVLIGFLLANSQSGVLADLNSNGINFLINIATGLILFEFGYRINLNWLKNNSLIVVTGLVESLATFIVVFLCATAFHITTMTALEFASLAIATSPVVIMYIVNQQQSSGQVTERLVHLTAINCILAIFSFKLIFGLLVFQKSGSFWQATWASILMLLVSVALGSIFAMLLSSMMKRVKTIALDRTVAFSILVIFIVIVAQAANLSPIVSALAFGLITRHRRVAMGKTQRSFGALGELLLVMLFVAAPTMLSWHSMWQGMWHGFGMALALILARLITKILVVGIFSHFSGISWLKGFLTGLALSPISVFSIFLLDQRRYAGVALNEQLASMATIIFLLEILGPIITKYALVKAKECLNV